MIEVNDGRRVDADIRSVVRATEGKANWLAEIRTQQYGAAFGIDGVNRVALGCHIDDIMLTLAAAGRDVHAGNKQRLTVDLIVQIDFVQKPERGTSHVPRGEHGFVGIPSRPVVVPVVGGDGGLRVNKRCGGQNQTGKQGGNTRTNFLREEWHYPSVPLNVDW